MCPSMPGDPVNLANEIAGEVPAGRPRPSLFEFSAMSQGLFPVLLPYRAWTYTLFR